jgi:hypothetical protein
VTTTTTTKQSKTWVIAAAALVACVGVLAWILARPSDDALPDDNTASEPVAEPDTPAAAAKPAPAAAAAAKPTEAAKPAPPPAAPEVDLFADSMPDFMVDIHARVLDKKPLGVKEQKLLYNWGKENKDDARPQLLLAWDCVNRDWDGMAVSMYGMAFRADPRSKDNKNLGDLLSLASKHEPGRVEFDDAAKIVTDGFGQSALPEIEAQLAKLNAAGELQRAARLSKLRDDLGKL